MPQYKVTYNLPQTGTETSIFVYTDDEEKARGLIPSLMAGATVVGIEEVSELPLEAAPEPKAAKPRGAVKPRAPKRAKPVAAKKRKKG